MKKILYYIFAAAVLGVLFGTISSAGAEETEPKLIFIAGNPSMAPIEYYDTNAGCYRGILPDIYKELSKETGYSYVYIAPGPKNQQSRLARNSQADIISAHYQGDVGDLTHEHALFPSIQSTDQEGYAMLCIGFTKAAPEDIVLMTSHQLERINTNKILNMTLIERAEKNKATDIFRFIVIIAILGGIVAVLLVTAYKNYNSIRKSHISRRTDKLTGLGNDLFYSDSFARLIESDMEFDYYVAYVATDSEIALSYLGAKSFQNLQQYAADLLRQEVKNGEFTARIKDGSFAIVFQATDDERAKYRMETLLSKINSKERPDIPKYDIIFQCGIYRIPSSAITAYTALYIAQQGYANAQKNSVLCLLIGAELHRAEERKLYLQQSMPDALANNEFTIYVQLVMDMRNRKVCGGEALSRWQNPTEGLLTPDYYIPAMRESGIIDQLDFYTLEKTCRLLHAWSKTKNKTLWLSCNFTRITISRNDFLPRFFEIVQKYKFDSRNLIIEITEDSLEGNETTAYKNIIACKKAGYRLALDDMCSGYASLTDLCLYPIDVIKIDREFIRRTVSKDNLKLLKAITDMAHKMNTKVLCEGVSTEKELDFSINASCDYIQGYYYYHVLPVDEAIELLKSRR